MSHAILNVATGNYTAWQKRLRFSLGRVGFSGALAFWTDQFPQNSPTHRECSYAFKLFAIEEAAKQHSSLLWLDSGLYAVRPVEPVFSVIERDGYYLTGDQNAIRHFCSNATVSYFNTSFDVLGDAKLVSGAMIGLNLEHPAGRQLFEKWKAAYKAGLYKGTVSKHSGMQEHRGDETILGVIAFQDKLKVHTPYDFFGSDSADIQPNTVFRSGYYDRADIPSELWGLEVIAEHTVRLPVDGVVLDVGARSFTFSREMIRRGHRTIAIEPDPTVRKAEGEGFELLSVALAGIGQPSSSQFEMSADPQARRLSSSGTVTVPCVDILHVMKSFNVDHFGLVKLDCEGAEVGILETWPGPIADQITVEFHDHVKVQDYSGVLKRLGQWYDVVQHKQSLRHHIGTPNYWDSLFCLKRGK